MSNIESLIKKIVLVKPKSNIKKVKLKQGYFDKLNGEHKKSIKGIEDARSILGIPIEVDDTVTNEYEIEYKTLT